VEFLEPNEGGSARLCRAVEDEGEQNSNKDDCFHVVFAAMIVFLLRFAGHCDENEGVLRRRKGSHRS